MEEKTCEINDRIIGFAIAFQIAAVACKNMLTSTLIIVNKFNTQLNIIISIISILLYLRCLSKLNFRLYIKSLYIILLTFIFITSTYLFNKELFTYEWVISDLLVYIAYCIPLLIFVPLINNPTTFLSYLYYASYIMSIVSIITFGLVLLGFETVKNYSMSYGAAVMIPSIFLFSKAFKEKSIRDYTLASVCTFAILAIGSRWPLLCIGAFLIYSVLSKTFSNKEHAILMLMIILFLLFLVNKYYIDILERVIIFLDQYGISSRSIRLILSGKATYDSGRSLIYKQLLLKLQDSPLLGYGAFGGIVALDGDTPHHFILDIWANFGYIFGSIILVISIYKTIKYFWIGKGTAYAELIAIYACMIWPKVLVGGRFWSAKEYWMLIALFLLGSSLYKRQAVLEMGESGYEG